MEEGTLLVKPDIKKYKLKDDIERYYIDTYEKLYWIVDERFKEQKKKYPDAEPIIDLSRLVICIQNGLRISPFSLESLCVKISGIIDLKDKTKSVPTELDVESGKDEFQIEVKYEINFGYSIIYLMQFNYIKFLKYVNFSGTQFLDLVWIRDSVFFEDVCFDENDINQNIEYNCKLPVDIGGIMFIDNLFKKRVTFNRENWNSGAKISFSRNTYEGDVSFMMCSFSDYNGFYYDLSRSVFKGNVVIDCNKYNNEDLYGNTLFSHVNFCGSYFHKEFSILNAIIGEISMQKCYFDDTVNISNNKYNASSSLDFSYSTINSLLFIGRNFDLINSQPNKLFDKISFSRSLITKDAFLLIRNINNEVSTKRAGTLDFSYANILGTVTVQDSKLNQIKLDKSTLIGDINIENVETDYDSRESIAKIKNEFFQRNDIVNLLFYKAKEMKYYSEHLEFKYKIITNVFRWFTKNWFYNTIGICFLPILLLLSLLPIKSLEKVREYTLLYLNRISNSFGMSWGQGVLFTCVTAWIFFVLINTLGITSLPDKTSSPLFVWGWNGWNSFSGVWQNYLRMFYLTKFEDVFNTSIRLNALGETLFFVSKIFVSYGIYQTISAFRKYGK